MDYDEALAELDRHLNLEKTPAVAGRVEGLSLDTMRALCHALGDPQVGYPVVHLTGTNGKGSVGAMVTLLLEEHGLSVGTYASPHLQRVNERLRWTGQRLLDVDREGEVVAARSPDPGGDVPDEVLARLVGQVVDAEVVAGVRASWFEVLTAAALTWFAEVPVDAAVVEVGLLGRWDATNVVDAEVAVVTSVGPDHTDFTGDWRRAIAEEKSGIVKPGSFLVLGETDPALQPVFAAAAGDRLWVRDDDFGVDADRVALGGHLVDLYTPGGVIPEIWLPVHGEHQVTNAAIALASAEAFFGRPLDEEVVRGAFSRLALPGRFEVVEHAPLVVVDGAHNPDGCATVMATLDEEFDVAGRRILVVGFLDGRDPDALLEALDARRADLLVACSPDSPRALPAERLAEITESLDIPTAVVPDVAAAVDQARTIADPDDAIVVTGSLYVAGAARAALGLPPP
ncbi:MAG: Mur ligase family protein [Acidimicrobiales bacterium]